MLEFEMHLQQREMKMMNHFVMMRILLSPPGAMLAADIDAAAELPLLVDASCLVGR